MTPTLAPTSTPEPTATPSPTSTPTIVPTVIGGSEPLIAFIANDRQGNLNLFIDGFLTGKPQMITRITLPEEDPISKVRWSPDGRKLAYTNANDQGERWLIVYNLAMNAFQEVYKLPSGRYVDRIEWSEDGNILTFVTANMRPPGPNLATRRIHLPDLIYLPVEGENLWINEVSRLNTQAKCFDSSDPVVRRLSIAGYRDLCYFPQLDQYGGLYYGEAGVDYYLFSQDGQEARMMVRFPADFTTNGAIDLLLSPDRNRLLLVAKPQRSTGSDTWPGIPMAIPLLFTEPLTMTVAADVLYYPEPVFEKTPPPHAIGWKYAYGWSPDSRDILLVRIYHDGFDRTTYRIQGEFAIVDAASGEDVSVYTFPPDLQPQMSFGFGYDLVWTSP